MNRNNPDWPQLQRPWLAKEMQARPQVVPGSRCSTTCVPQLYPQPQAHDRPLPMAMLALREFVSAVEHVGCFKSLQW